MGMIFSEAQLISMRGDLSNAEKCYREAINSGPCNYAVFSNLGIICQTTQRTEEACMLYQKAIEANPSHPNAYINQEGYKRTRQP